MLKRSLIDFKIEQFSYEYKYILLYIGFLISYFLAIVELDFKD